MIKPINQTAGRLEDGFYWLKGKWLNRPWIVGSYEGGLWMAIGSLRRLSHAEILEAFTIGPRIEPPKE